MTVTTTSTLRCDTPDCPNIVTEHMHPDPCHVRSRGWDQGWFRRWIDGRMVDVCPDHCAEDET